MRGRDSASSTTASLPPEELLSLGTALLAALSTDPDMASHPHLLSTVPLLLGLLADGPAQQSQGTPRQNPPAGEPRPGPKSGGGEGDGGDGASESTPRLDQAMAADCYQILEAVCSLETGPEQLLSRGAVPTLCRAVEHDQVAPPG